MGDSPDNCPKCNAPIEGRTIAWSVYQCGRTTDDPDGEGYNACEYATSLLAENERLLVQRQEEWNRHGEHRERLGDQVDHLRQFADEARSTLHLLRDVANFLSHRPGEHRPDWMNRASSRASEALLRLDAAHRRLGIQEERRASPSPSSDALDEALARKHERQKYLQSDPSLGPSGASLLDDGEQAALDYLDSI